MKNTDIHQGGDCEPPYSYDRIVLKYLYDGINILNLGCGCMTFERTIKSHYKNTYITSVDIDAYFDKYKNYTDAFFIRDVEKPLFLKEYDIVTFFELVEHIYDVDQLLINCNKNLKKGGLLIFGFPNLASIFGRLELLLGFQPHILEVSNVHALFGTGIFGRINYGMSIFDKKTNARTIHHIKGVTFKAMKEMIDYYEFDIIKSIGFPNILKHIPSLAPKIIMICKKR